MANGVSSVRWWVPFGIQPGIRSFVHRHGIRGRFSFAGNFYNNDVVTKRWGEDSFVFFFFFLRINNWCVLEIL